MEISFYSLTVYQVVYNVTYHRSYNCFTIKQRIEGKKSIFTVDCADCPVTFFSTEDKLYNGSCGLPEHNCPGNLGIFLQSRAFPTIVYFFIFWIWYEHERKPINHKTIIILLTFTVLGTAVSFKITR